MSSKKELLKELLDLIQSKSTTKEQIECRIHQMLIDECNYNNDNKYKLPRPLEAWNKARELELSDYINWHLKKENN